MRLYKTELGQTAFKQRSPLLSARQRSLFILVDGKKTAAEVLEATAGMGLTAADIEHLLAVGFVTDQAPGGAVPVAPVPTGKVVITPARVAPAPSATPGSAPAAPATPSAPTSAPVPVERHGASQRSEQQRYFDAKPIATQLSASLGLRGFMLNLAVEGATGYADLLKLLPKMQSALGVQACRALEQALLD